jgi:predicted membrane-bound spermidine synthase
VLHAGIGIVHFEESQYYTIRVDRTVRDDNGSPLTALHLDHLVHSYSDPKDHRYLEYDYLRAFNEVIQETAKRRADFRLLFIGGGGYTLPRLVERDYPHARVDVAEIDPAVTRVAKRWFGLSRNGRIRTVNQDARWFAMRSPEEGVYDAIFIDAFNDLSVPYHLTTLEMTQRLRELLRPDGVLVSNLIDDYGKGRFLASYARTLQAVFGESNVAIVVETREDLKSDRSTFVVVGSRAAMPVFYAAHTLPHEELTRYVLQRDAIVLTDDYAPVDNMLAPLFTQRFIDEVE